LTRLFHFPSLIAFNGLCTNYAKAWTAEEVSQLRNLVRQNTPAHVVARKLGRSIDAVYVKASRVGISLRLMPSSRSDANG
jgi:hypothetical protein